MHRILVVEDDLDTQTILRQWFAAKSDRMVVAIAPTAELALEKLAADPFDTLLTDVFLPGIDGVDLLLTARRLYPSVRVVVMSAFATPELEAAALDSGAIQFLRKPIDFEELEQAFFVDEERGGGLSRLAGDLDLFDLCLLFLFSSRSGGLRVDGNGSSGILIFAEGHLVHASANQRTGAAAFKALTESAGFDFVTLPPTRLEEWPPNLRVDAAGVLRARQRLRSGMFGGSFSELQWRASGVASGLALRDLLRVIAREKRSCAINATSGSRIGVLIIHEGDLVDADSGAREGLSAAREILSWPQLEVELRQESHAANSGDRVSLEALLSDEPFAL